MFAPLSFCMMRMAIFLFWLTALAGSLALPQTTTPPPAKKAPVPVAKKSSTTKASTKKGAGTRTGKASKTGKSAKKSSAPVSAHSVDPDPGAI